MHKFKFLVTFVIAGEPQSRTFECEELHIDEVGKLTLTRITKEERAVIAIFDTSVWQCVIEEVA